ncbi:MAG: hypothetical protein WA194_01745 [Patescibacteria group bacterium]
MEIFEYAASGGTEFFFQFVDVADRTLFSVLRLRIPSWISNGGKPLFEALENAAVIREIHTYGDQMGIGETGSGGADSASPAQHRGFGKRLIEAAENLIRERYPSLSNVAVIAGAGTREYYLKRGFRLAEYGYMVKEIPR